MPKRKPIWMPDPVWSDEQYAIARWCADNNIIISPIGIHGKEKYKVCISLYDYRNVKCDKFEYDPDQVWEKVSEYQSYYYGKYRREDNKQDKRES